MGGGGVRDLFITSLRCPSELSLVLYNSVVFGVYLQCVGVPRNVTCDTNATRFKQSRWPPDSIMSFINLYLFHKRTRVRGIHVCLLAGM